MLLTNPAVEFSTRGSNTSLLRRAATAPRRSCNYRGASFLISVGRDTRTAAKRIGGTGGPQGSRGAMPVGRGAVGILACHRPFGHAA